MATLALYKTDLHCKTKIEWFGLEKNISIEKCGNFFNTRSAKQLEGLSEEEQDLCWIVNTDLTWTKW